MRSYRFAFAIFVLGGFLAGCSGAGPSLQPAVAPPNARVPAHRLAGASWVLPQAKGQDLLYISDIDAQAVFIYTYGHGYKLVGELTGFFNPEGLCVDKAGDVYVTNDTSYGVHQITEYAHGGTSQIRTLNDPDGRVNGCSVDPKSGDLAVANEWGASDGIGNVAVYPHASGSPTSYSNPNIYYYYFCGYDNKGNLFVDGETQGSVFGLGELRKGGHSLDFISIDETIYLPGGVQWDGKYLAVGDQVAVKHNFTSTVYDFAIKGSAATTVNTMVLTGSKQVSQFWIPLVDSSRKHRVGTRLIGPNEYGGNTLIWDYPSGGSAILTIGGENYPIGATVSLAKK
jgi:WD40 repeat protein